MSCSVLPACYQHAAIVEQGSRVPQSCCSQIGDGRECATHRVESLRGCEGISASIGTPNDEHFSAAQQGCGVLDRAVVILPVRVKVALAGSQISAVARVPVELLPPVTRTLPSMSNVAACSSRASIMLPVAVKVPAAIAAETLMALDTPVIDAVTVSVAEMVMLPVVLSVAEKDLVPFVNVELDGSTAWASVLVKCTIPE